MKTNLMNMTTVTEDLNNQIIDALDKAFEELFISTLKGKAYICGKQSMYDKFGEELDKILNQKK